MYASLRSFFGWYTDQTGGSNPSQSLPRVRIGAPKARPAPHAVVTEAGRDPSPRVRMIIRLAFELGMRRSEIAQVHADDLWEDLAGWSITVHGKGNKTRFLPLSNDLASAIRNAAQQGWLFPSDRHPSGHLTAEYVGKLAAAAMPGPWTLHTLRHSCATDLYAQTHDLLLVQQLLGHSSVATTQIYVRPPADALRAALGERAAS